ncbi:MAG: protein phosphatase 2C domain-containing protein [Bacteroidia bacterium]
MKLSIEHLAALSETGSRFLNEDRLYPSQIDAAEDIPQVAGLYMVADGAGGQEKGDVAARIAIQEFARYIHTFPPKNAQITYGFLSAALLRVEEAFHQHITHHPEAEGMATTITLMYADDNGVAVGWIGNSRLYHIRNGETLFQTRDQMVIQDMVAHGKLSQEEAEAQKGNFTQARMIHGTAQPTDLDFRFIAADEIEEGDTFLLCTDGVTKEISDKELQNIIAGPQKADDLKAELIRIVENESSDNYTALVVELSKVAEGAKEIPLKDSPAIVPGASISDDVELDLDDLEEPPAAVEAIAEPGGTSILDRYASNDVETVEEAAPSQSEGGTLLERIQAEKAAAAAGIAATIDSDSQEEASTKEESGSAGNSRPDISPEPHPGFLQRYGIPLLLGALLIAALGYALNNLGGNEKHDQYVAALQKSRNAQNPDSVLFYGNKALALAENDKDRNAAKNMIQKGTKDIKRDILALQDKASMHLGQVKEGGYADLWQAQEYLDEAKSMYGNAPHDAQNKAQLAEIVALNDSVAAMIAAIKEPVRVAQLLSKAEELCKSGYGDEADRFFVHARDMIGDDKKLMAKFTAINEACYPPTIATRGNLESPEATEEPATTATPAKTESVAANTSADNNATPAVTTDASVSKLVKPTKAQLEYLEKGIALFEKQRISNSNYEATKAAEYLDKAGPARTGAAAYMLSVLYNQGKGVKENEAKAFEYSKESALKGYPGGHYVYASILLKNENVVDSTTAKKSLNIAASKGHPDATNLLYQIMQPTARLRP